MFADKKKEKIRIKDIAKQANVSIGTVDRVLHNRGEVKEETRQRVEAIIKEMGYTPNMLAKSLALKKTYRIATLIPEANKLNPYWEKPMKGILKGAAEIKDYQTFVDMFNFNATDENSFVKAFRKIIEQEPDGVIFNPIFKEVSTGFSELLDSMNIPYVYIDTELERGNNLAYFGQKAKQSGFVAAKIMSQMLPPESKILIVKISNKKKVSHHLLKREEGFIEFFATSNRCKCSFISCSIDLLEKNEPALTLTAIFEKNPDIKGVFVPNSRVFRVAEYLENANLNNLLVLGYDLINQNIDFLKKGIIDFLIGQKPEEQGYKSVMTLFNYIVLKKEIDKTSESAIDIIIKENLDFYR